MSTDKMILIFGVIMLHFISSTNCSSEETKMESLVTNMKEFLEYVSKWDSALQIPQPYHEFGDVKLAFWLGWRTMKFKKGRRKRFREQYEKFVNISNRCISQYVGQLNWIVQTQKRVIGNKKYRDDLVDYIKKTFKKEMALKGAEDSEVSKKYKELMDELDILCQALDSMVDPPPPPPPPPKEKKKKRKHHKHTSHSLSYSSEYSASSSEEHEHKDGHGGGNVVAAAAAGAAAGLVVGAVGTLAVEEAMENSASSGEEIIDESHYSASEQISGSEQAFSG